MNGLFVESSMITLIGVCSGILLGLATSRQFMKYLAEVMPGMHFEVPWLNILIILGLSYGFSLLMALLPARQASRIAPADALRYE